MSIPMDSKTLATLGDGPHATYITRLIHDVAERASYDGTLGAQVAALAVRGITHATGVEWQVLVETYGIPTTRDWELAQRAYGPTKGLPGLTEDEDPRCAECGIDLSPFEIGEHGGNICDKCSD